MSDFDADREEALNLMAESLLRELDLREEARLRHLLVQHPELQSAWAAFQAMATGKTLLHHEKTAAQARQRFLDTARVVNLNTAGSQPLPKRLWHSARFLGGAFLAAQLALLAVYFNLGQELLFPKEPAVIYRTAVQYDPCESVTVKFRPDVTIEQITEVLKKANLSVVAGPINTLAYVVQKGAYSESDLVEIFAGLGVVEVDACVRERDSRK